MKTIFLAIITLVSANSYANQKAQTIGGRYQLVQLSEYRRDQFMIDTETGEVWNRLCVEPNKDKSDCFKFQWVPESIEQKPKKGDSTSK